MAVPSVLVTGSGGVAGRAVVQELERTGYRAIPVASSDADLRDMAATTALFETHRPDYVVHLAGRVHGLMGNIGSQGSAFYDNIRMNINVVEASRAVGVQKLVAMGSTAVYSDSVPLPMSEDGIWFGPPHDSEKGYASAKLAMLAQLEAYKDEYGMDYAFVVSTNLYGPGDRFDEVRGHVLPSLVSKIHRAKTEGLPLEVWGTGTPTRDFLYSGDAARAIVMVLEQLSGVVNMATGVSVTIRQAVDTLVEVAGFDGEVRWDVTKPDGQHARAYDISRLSSIGWAPQASLADGLAETFAWYDVNWTSARR